MHDPPNYHVRRPLKPAAAHFNAREGLRVSIRGFALRKCPQSITASPHLDGHGLFQYLLATAGDNRRCLSQLLSAQPNRSLSISASGRWAPTTIGIKAQTCCLRSSIRSFHRRLTSCVGRQRGYSPRLWLPILTAPYGCFEHTFYADAELKAWGGQYIVWLRMALLSPVLPRH